MFDGNSLSNIEKKNVSYEAGYTVSTFIISARFIFKTTPGDKRATSVVWNTE